MEESEGCDVRRTELPIMSSEQIWTNTALRPGVQAASWKVKSPENRFCPEPRDACSPADTLILLSEAYFKPLTSRSISKTLNLCCFRALSL